MSVFGQLTRAAPGILAKRQEGVNLAEQESYKRKQAEQAQRLEQEAAERAFAQQVQEFNLRREDTNAIRQQNEQYRRDNMTMLDKDRDAQRGQMATIAEQNRLSREQTARENREGRADLARLVASLRPNQGPRAKSAPPSAVRSVVENMGQVKVINDALSLFEKTKGDGLGPTNAFGGAYVKDLVGISTDDEKNLRAAVGDIGSLVIRDRSGAAVTAAEFPRLRPFIPSPSDPPAKIKQNLLRMKAIIDEETELYKANYSEEQGYNPIVTGVGEKPVEKAAANPKDFWQDLVDSGIPKDEATRQTKARFKIP